MISGSEYNIRVRLAALLAVAAGIAAGMAGAASAIEAFGRKWAVPEAADWSLSREDGVEGLHLARARGPLPGPRRPIQFALAPPHALNYTRLTLEADVKPLGRSLLVVVAWRDEAHFDYVHLSTDRAAEQPMHNGVFHVYGGERVRISPEEGPASFLQSGRWFHVAVTHDATTRTITATVDGQAVPSLRAVDLSLGPGLAGFGTFDETAAFRNVRVTTAAMAGNGPF